MHARYSTKLYFPANICPLQSNKNSKFNINCDGPTRYARIHFTRGKGLHLNSYNWAICEDLKLRKEEEGKGGEGELYTQ